MIKLASCLCIVLSGALAGARKASAYQRRRKELEAALELLQLMELELTYRKDALYKIFAATAIQKACVFSELLLSCSERLQQQCSLQEAWKQAMQQVDTAAFSEQDLQILQDFTLGLGRSDALGQKDLLQPIQVKLTERIQEARAEELQKGKLYQGLGLSTGVLIAIVIF